MRIAMSFRCRNSKKQVLSLDPSHGSPAQAIRQSSSRGWRSDEALGTCSCGHTRNIVPARGSLPFVAALQKLLSLEGWSPRDGGLGSVSRAPELHVPLGKTIESFTRQVLWKLLKVVKFGEVISYQQLAALAGNPKAARAVGGAMRNNPVPILIPCHRVVCGSGAVGNYSGGLAVKEWLLVHKGHQAGKPGLGGSSGLAGAWLKRVGATSGSLPVGRN
ncbi:methylated-DNA--protein-cysteine methyltransferase-like [Piliocolobus tephrosceles]|uniref:methylated-DNA--protein-cysteine methyltransferase-like n=1 Tax=Piliocolobus tephrosceles TaxID=591936 RepID=UPI00130105FD|nr:methylated-DNA--protein-cysteine methyltransferase-like [Piliocolobus tephrosceles]